MKKIVKRDLHLHWVETSIRSGLTYSVGDKRVKKWSQWQSQLLTCIYFCTIFIHRNDAAKHQTLNVVMPHEWSWFLHFTHSSGSVNTFGSWIINEIVENILCWMKILILFLQHLYASTAPFKILGGACGQVVEVLNFQPLSPSPRGESSPEIACFFCSLSVTYLMIVEINNVYM